MAARWVHQGPARRSRRRPAHVGAALRSRRRARQGAGAAVRCKRRAGQRTNAAVEGRQCTRKSAELAEGAGVAHAHGVAERSSEQISTRCLFGGVRRENARRACHLSALWPVRPYHVRCVLSLDVFTACNLPRALRLQLAPIQGDSHTFSLELTKVAAVSACKSGFNAHCMLSRLLAPGDGIPVVSLSF